MEQKQNSLIPLATFKVEISYMRNAIDDYFFDVVRDEKGIDIPLDQLDEMEQQIMDVARARFPG